jgi:ComF family protein
MDHAGDPFVAASGGMEAAAWRWIVPSRALLTDLLSTILPAVCRSCGGPLLRLDTVPVCSVCIAAVNASRISAQECRRLCRCCGERLAVESERFAGYFGEAGALCGACRMAPPEFQRAVHYAVYDDAMREMLHLLKYEHARSVARVLGPMLAEAIAQLAPEMQGGEVLVAAVPLFPSRERRRGYNQTVLLAENALATLRRAQPQLRLRLESRLLLRRVRDTEALYTLTPRQRRENLRNAFALRDADKVARPLAGRDVLLLDDIYTTGATARECSRVLRRAGAERVWVATLARAQQQTAALWEWGDDAERARAERAAKAGAAMWSLPSLPSGESQRAVVHESEDSAAFP